MPQIKEYKVAKYYGMNNSKDSTALVTGEAELIENFLVSIGSKLIRRDGLTLIGTDASTNAGLGLGHRIVASTKTQFKVETTTIKYLTGGAWSNMSGAGATGLTTGLEMNFCSANDFVYGFNGTDDVRKLNATDAVTVNVDYIVALDLGPDSTVCDYQSVVLDAGFGYDSYNWSTGSTLQTITVDTAGVGLGTFPYWVDVTNGVCTATDTVYVTFTVCTGNTELSQNASVNIFPNPTNGTVNNKPLS